MTIDFYYMHLSAPCRSILLTAKVLGIKLNLKETNLLEKEHLTPEFLKMNPQHTIPTLNDNGFCIWESRAILGYLVQKYGKDDSLYPKDPKKRAIVDQRLYFDMGVLYQRFGEYIYPQIFSKAAPDPEKLKKVEESYEFLNIFLEGKDFVAGNCLTIADIAIIASVSTFEVLGFDLSKYPNVARWFDKLQKKLPDYKELNHEGCIKFKEFKEVQEKSNK